RPCASFLWPAATGIATGFDSGLNRQLGRASADQKWQPTATKAPAVTPRSEADWQREIAKLRAQNPANRGPKYRPASAHRALAAAAFAFGGPRRGNAVAISMWRHPPPGVLSLNKQIPVGE